jgi:hypothetical protein
VRQVLFGSTASLSAWEKVMQSLKSCEIGNRAYHISVSLVDDHISFQILDRAMNFILADQYGYRATRVEHDHLSLFHGLRNPTIESSGECLILRGTLAGLDLEHTFTLPAGKPILQERLALSNTTSGEILLTDFACGALRTVTNEVGTILPELNADRFQAIPFLHRPTDPAGLDSDFTIEKFLSQTGRETRVNEWAAVPWGQGFVPSFKRFSEGWAWQHGEHTLGIIKFNQAALEFSILAAEVPPDHTASYFAGTPGFPEVAPAEAVGGSSAARPGVMIRYAGAGMLENEPSCLRSDRSIGPDPDGNLYGRL